GVDPSAADAATHVAATAVGPRPVQGYLIPALIAPGWVALGRVGAELTIAVIAAVASAQVFLLLRETVRHRGLATATWALATLLAPVLPLAASVYPNALGAALVAGGYRYAFTAPDRKPLLAGVLLGMTLLLTPRDGILLLALLPFLWRAVGGSRAVFGVVVVAIVAVVLHTALYGIPLPYAGYLIGTQQAQALSSEPSIALRPHVALPAMLFDGTFGLAGTAPWIFLALLGVRGLRRRALRPAVAAIAVSLGALSLFRYWEGGYAPPARYLVELVPLAAPFVALGIAAASRWWPARAFAAVAVALSVVSTLLLAAMPNLGLNSAFETKPRDWTALALGVDPLAWLPSFQPTTDDWYTRAYPALAPALIVCALLVWLGAARPPALRVRSWPVAYAVASGTLLLVALAAVPPAGLELAESAIDRWIPYALALAFVASAAVASLAAPAVRGPFLGRSLALASSVPLASVLAATGEANGVLGWTIVAVIAAFGANALHALWRSIDRLGDRTTALALGGVALAVFLMLLPYHRTAMPTASDEPHYLVIVESLLYDRDLDVRNDYAAERYRAYYPDRLPDMHVIEVGTAAYPIRDLGLPIVAALPFALGGRSGVLVLISAIGAALVAVLYLLARDVGADRRTAFLATAAVGFTHPVLTYTTQIYPELASALVFALVARALRAGSATGVRGLAAASALVGLLPLLSTRNWLIAVGAGLVVAWCTLRPLWRRFRLGTALQRVAAGAGPFSLIVLAIAAVNYAMFRVFLPSAGYYLIADQQQVLAYTPHVGALGLLFDRVFGLIGRAPLYLLAFVGIPLAWRWRGGAMATLAAGSLASFLYIANIAYWWADGSPPSRYLLAGIPFFAMLVAAGIALARRSAVLGGLAWGLGGASAFVTAVYAVLPNLRYDLAAQIRATDGSGQLWTFLGRIVRPEPGVLFPSLVRPDLETAVLSLAWVGVAAALAYAGLRVVRSQRVA
ncbi:MAG TPA: hypothetical protein VFM93_04990, partial [Candidatus Limnocylindria bacterium]|nr:hypothetical protein [Candidatus Limnocylindria bacterium]